MGSKSGASLRAPQTWTAPCLQSSYIALDLDVDIVDSYIAMDVDLSDLGVCKPNVRICLVITKIQTNTWTAPCLLSSYIAMDLDVDMDSYIAMDVDSDIAMDVDVSDFASLARIRTNACGKSGTSLWPQLLHWTWTRF